MCFVNLQGPAKTYKKMPEPLSPVARADRCAVFVKVKTMCANKGGDKAALAAVPLHLRIANEGSLLTWSPQAVSRCLQSLLC